MLDSSHELLEAVRLGETSFLELKEVRFSGHKVAGPSRDDLADELAAFANSQGGVLVLGVEDKSRDIVGIPHDRLDVVVDFVKEICNDSITPPVEQLVLDRLLVSSGTGRPVNIVKLEIPRSLFVHRSPGGYWHRVGDSKRVMTPEFLARLFQQRSQTRLIRFDEQPVAGAQLDDLADYLWMRLRTPRSDDEHETFLVKLGMAVRADDGMVGPTVAGVLMGSETPERWLPNAYVQAVAYRGSSVTDDDVAANYQLGRGRHHGTLGSSDHRGKPVRPQEHAPRRIQGRRAR